MDFEKERKSVSSQEREMQIYGFKKIWEELHGLAERGILVEVEHVKARRTKKEKKNMSQFERFVAEGNEKADELAKAGAMLDEGFLWQKQWQKPCSRTERRCTQRCSMWPASTAW